MNPDESVVLRTYAGEALASIAASRLESEGIEAIIQKDDVGGAYPALQMSRGVRLLVKPEDVSRAEEILTEIEAEDTGEVEQPEPEEDRKRTKSNPIALIGVFLLGLIIGHFLEPALILVPRNYTGVIKQIRNEQGKPGRFSHYEDGQLTHAEEDRNYDGKPDAWYKYRKGGISTGTLDDNFDGKPDVWITYKNEFNYTMKVDTDFDGKPDATIYYVNGLKQRVDWYPNDSPIIERRQLFEHEVLKEELVDTDQDGIFDLRITYDRYERPIAKTKCRIPN
jgi:hypothetical protein